MARFNLDMADNMYDELKNVSKEQRRSMGDIVKSLIYEWLIQRRNDKLQLMQLTKLGEENGRKDD